MNKENCPLVEKYRPDRFENIVLDEYNSTILNNIIETSYFPNIILYGPPGTGKTTTILNLISTYQQKHGKKSCSSTIHLNASDERGIDTIRNQISTFVKSNPLFDTGMKFVVLDEVDYMTSSAQQALKYILQKHPNNVRFCLMCNYISKIDEGLLSEFIVLRFNQLPENLITQFLENIVDKENLNIPKEAIKHIQQLYKSDMRSMINCIQNNQHHNYETVLTVLTNQFAEELYLLFVDNAPIPTILERIDCANLDTKYVMKFFFNYLIRNKPEIIRKELLDFISSAVHFSDCNNSCLQMYCVTQLGLLLGGVGGVCGGGNI
jgi:replication factor C subunit 3/5